MPQQELLTSVVSILTDLGIEHMVTGSIASSLQGEPRSTHDIDLVVALSPSDAPRLVQAFPSPAFYLSEDAIRDAIKQSSQFNLLSLDDGEKVDFWLLTNEPFDQSRFARKRHDILYGMNVNVSAPEDTILAKIRWAKLCGGSEKQMTDALRIFELQGSLLDRNYLDDWAKQLGVGDLLLQIASQAQPEA